MKCTQCGAEIPDNAKFCKVCGAKQEVKQQHTAGICKACGAPLKPGAAFCTACGAKIQAETESHAVPEKKADSEPVSLVTAASSERGEENRQPESAPKPAEQTGRKPAGFATGAPIEKSAVFQQQSAGHCKACGAPLKPGVAFCTACGAKIQAETEPQTASKKKADGEPISPASDAPRERSEAIRQPTPKSAEQAGRVPAGFAAGAPIEKSTAARKPEMKLKTTDQTSASKKKKYIIPIVIAAVLLFLAGIAAALMLKFNVFAAPADPVAAEDNSPQTQTEQQTEEVKEVAPEQIDSNDADLVADGQVSLEGTVKISTDTRLFLDWDEPKTILLKEDDGSYAQINDVTSVYLENDGVDSALWDELPVDPPVIVTGELELDGSRLILHAHRMTDTSGGSLTYKQPDDDESEEILPQSDDRLLTQQDVSGLSLREINYAKNEIYARHGRRFTSAELQNYFDAQSWYHGSVDAADFKESWLSDVEKKNADFLAEVEFGRSPNGYQLDQ